MEQQRDETIECARCGAAFPAPTPAAPAPAADGGEKALSSAPGLCKACRSADRAAGGAGKQKGQAQKRRAPRPEGRQQRPLRGTGDPNEYRSPMPDPSFGALVAHNQGHLRGRARPPWNDGNYRAPGFRDGPRDAGPRPMLRGGRSPHAGGRYPITCAACGAASEVPFQPAEGQKVYCRACFRAEKPR
jgi:CxxC-x17-CxxC domain-containing protein